LNRAIENRTEKSPVLSDLRDTGEWENHARGGFMLMREVSDTLGVYVRKNTEGPNDVYYSLHFDGPRAAAEELVYNATHRAVSTCTQPPPCPTFSPGSHCRFAGIRFER